MELLLTVLLWIVAVIGGFILLPFVLALVLFLFGLIAFLAIASIFGTVLIIVACGIFVADVCKPVTSWFKRTAGCK